MFKTPVDVEWKCNPRSIVFYNNIYFSLAVTTRPPQTTRSNVFLVFFFFFVFLLYLCSFKHQLTHRNFSPYVKIWSLSMLRSKLIFTKNQKQNNWHCVACFVISMVYTLIDHSSRPISARGFAQLFNNYSTRARWI